MAQISSSVNPNAPAPNTQNGIAPSNWRAALMLTITLRLCYSLLAAAFMFFLPFDTRLVRSNALTEDLSAPSRSIHYAFIGIWERFDTLWYVHIAQHGYSRPESVVFFPLFPAVVRVVGIFTGGVAASLLVASVSSFFLFWGLMRLLRMDYSSPFAWRTVLLCAVWPGAFVFFAGYAESTFLALIIWSIIMAREERWWVATLLGFAAGLAKAVGVLALVPLAVIGVRKRNLKVFWALLIPAGSLAYVVWLHREGLPSLVEAYGKYWRTSDASPLKTLWIAGTTMVQSPNVLLALNLLVLMGTCVLVWVARTRPEYVLYSVAAILFFLTKETAPPLQSMMRYVLAVFPVYMGVARLSEMRRIQGRFGILCAGLMAANLGLLWLFLGWSLVL